MTICGVSFDFSGTLHRELYTAVLEGSGVGNPGYLYDQLISASAWVPYSVTAPALKVAGSDLPVVVLGNIAWDIRPVFERAGTADYVRDFVLSYREGR